METEEAASSVDIPVFDISTPNQELAEDVVSAAHTYGFLFIKSTSVPMSAADTARTFSLTRTFFSLPTAVKQETPMLANNRGWTAMHSEKLDPSDSPSSGDAAQAQTRGDPKEAFNFGEFDSKGHAQQPLPALFTAAESQFASFYNQCRSLCQQLLALIACGLHIDESAGGASWFTTRHDWEARPSGSILRLLHYPESTQSSPSSSSSIRAGAHSDYGSLTLLFRQPGDAGLQIRPPTGSYSSQGWHSVPVTPQGTETDASPPVLVNIGDLLSYWTGGMLRSTVHRVIGSEGGVMDKQRYSIAYFCHPCRDTPLEPVPSKIVQEYVQRRQGEEGDALIAPGVKFGGGKALTAADHLQSRLRATYGWVDGVKA